LGELTLKEAFTASLAAHLRDPWLMLMLSALLALVIAGVSSIFKKNHTSDDDQSEIAEAQPRLITDSFVFLLIFIGLALTLLVEFLYLRDGFGVRMNTLFKFYYQAWVMMGCASAYGVWWLFDRLAKPASRVIFGLSATLFIGLGLVYTVFAIPSRANDFSGPANLDGASEVAQANPDDWAAIQWLDANAQSGFPAGSVPVILEAPGDSYHYEGRISTFTGYPTVLGWAGHEGQWRGNYDEQAKREPDIATIYTTSDGQAALDLLHKWEVDYVILGMPEQNYIRGLCSQPARACTATLALRKFDLVLQPVFSQGQVTIYRVP